MTPGARAAAAIAILDRHGATGAPADLVAGGHFRNNRYIGAKDRAAIAAMVYGVLRVRAQLDWWIEREGRLDPDPRRRVMTWLALCEGWTADKIAHAFDGDRFRPAPLDEAEARFAGRLKTRTLEHPLQPPAVQLNMPDWIMPALEESLGPAAARELAALGAPAALDLRVNVLKADRTAALAALAGAGITGAPTRWSPWGIRVEGRPPLSATAVFRDGLVEVQDEGSQLAAALADVAPGQRVCDFCAGAGGKTLALAAVMGNKGHVDACDTEPKRIAGATKRLRRAGVFNVTLHTLKSERDPWVKHHAGRYDRVLIDAPCTGTGTWRRNPDARWTLTADDVTELVALQRRILDSASRLVRPGGRMIYVTCSLLADENERQVEGFLAANDGFTVVPADAVWAATVGGAAAPGVSRYARLSPASAGTDGFFVAILERAPAAGTA
ncbi:MAG: RsmB/NOP family class I SAM-dependent RNA methyltransferase [Alphaproteobacteria bacterium]|nr:RsmB/NOP family class I SAM-dependent RNA methyltransferase [Alphaproteobacteria bacterium]